MSVPDTRSRRSLITMRVEVKEKGVSKLTNSQHYCIASEMKHHGMSRCKTGLRVTENILL